MAVKKEKSEEIKSQGMSLVALLAEVQAELKAPKGQRNTFGKYNYRSAEDIVEAVKPLLNSRGLILNISDRMLHIGDRYYIEAEAKVIGEDINGLENSISSTGLAREAISQAGMSDGQVTGATSSYARKYALNGLFAIDDTKDLDSDEYQSDRRVSDSEKKGNPVKEVPVQKPWLNQGKELDAVVKALQTKKKTLAEIKDYYNINKTILAELEAIV